MSFIETKSQLAKLMATENITVEHRSVATASFDVGSRVLTLPLFANLSPFLADLLVGHEVGHALETPKELLLEAIELKIAKSVINVIEDVRIERKIKNRFPGLRASFIKGYKELLEKDFFGVAGLDLNDLNFIDRVNMFSKAGAGAGINFVNETETTLLKEINNTETPKDVIVVALKVKEYLKQEKEEKKKRQQEENNPETNPGESEENDQEEENSEEQENDQEGNKQESNNYDSDDNEEDSEDEDSEGNQSYDDNEEDSEDEDEEDADKNSTQTSGDSGDQGEDEVESHTDEEFRRNENKLFEQSDRTYYYGNIPNLDLNEYVIDHKVIWGRYKKWHSTELYHDSKYAIEKDKEDLAEYQKVRLDANKVVSYLAKEFELRKNADQMKRTSVAKTGMLNMSKIYSYNFSDDIFKRMSIVPDGKSHGLVMFVDWSGSMGTHMNNTIKQLINISLFCKKVNIPFEVYAFTTEYDRVQNTKRIEGDIAFADVCNFHLLNILSNRMSASDFTYACSKLLNIGNIGSGRRGYYAPRWFCLGSTPLNEAIITAMKVIPEFQKRNKLQVVNTVFLTDGAGHDVNGVYEKYTDSLGNTRTSVGYGEGGRYAYGNKKKVFVMRDPITKHEVRVDQYSARNELTNGYLQLLKARTNCNIVGFYILSGREFNKVAREFFSKAADLDKIKLEFRKNKHQIVTSSGYDEYYLIRAENMNTEEPEFTVKENSTTRGLVSAFNKYATNRLTNRIVLNRFIGMIA